MIELVQISLVLLALLTVLLAGGVWIAIALMACGYVGMQFVGGNIPAGPVLATTIWGNSASWTLAALPLFVWMGEILFRTKLSDEMFRGLAPWLNRIPGRLMHVNVLAWDLRLGVGLLGRDLRNRRQDRPAGAQEARL